MRRQRSWTVHCVAMCQTCGKEWEDYKTAAAKAARHAKQTGHHVTGERGIAFEYLPAEGVPKKAKQYPGTTTRSKAYREGYRAYREGVPMRQTLRGGAKPCPYDDVDRRHDWEAGWTQASLEDDR